MGSAISNAVHLVAPLPYRRHFPTDGDEKPVLFVLECLLVPHQPEDALRQALDVGVGLRARVRRRVGARRLVEQPLDGEVRRQSVDAVRRNVDRLAALGTRERRVRLAAGDAQLREAVGAERVAAAEQFRSAEDVETDGAFQDRRRVVDDDRRHRTALLPRRAQIAFSSCKISIFIRRKR